MHLKTLPPKTLPQYRKPSIRKPLRHTALAAAITGLSFAAVMPNFAIAAESATVVAEQRYSIPAGALADALTLFASQTGVTVQFDASLTTGLQTQGFSGVYSVEQGFAKLLQGTGLTFTHQGEGVYVVQALGAAINAMTLPPVKVSADTLNTGQLPKEYNGGQLARGGRVGILGNIDTLDAPFNLTSFTVKTIENQQARTIADVVAKDPSVRSTAQSGDVADAFYIRGFPIGDNNVGEIAFDGLYGVAPNYRLLADYAERVEVLKGPGAMVYGMSPNSGVGGTINIVPKRATDDLTRIRLDYSDETQAGGHFDLARRIGDERQFGVRLNAGHHDGDTAIDHQSRESTLGALALDYQGQRWRTTLDLINQNEKVDAPSRRPWLTPGVDVPSAPDAENNITQPWEWYESEEQSGLLRAEYDIHSQWTLFSGFGTAKTEIDRLFNTPILLNTDGDTTVTPTRARFDIERRSAELGLRGHFSTGSVAHQLSLQWNWYDDQVDTGSTAGTAYTSNIYAPITHPAQYVAAPNSSPPRSANRLDGLALADTLEMLDDQLQITLGLRKQQVQTDNFASNGSKTTYDESAITPLIGVVYKPWQQISIYANYIEGLSQGDTAPDTADNGGEVFSPYKTEQLEAGIKLDRDGLMTTFSLFQITRPSGLMVENRFTEDGEQRNRGVELSVYGAVNDRLRLYGGATWIDAELTETGNPATEGNTAVGVPKIQASLTAEWDIFALPGTTLTGGIFHSGKQYVDQTNNQRLDAWTTLDIGARYQTEMAGKPLTFRADLHNITGKDYWAGSSRWGTLIPGAPRTFQLSMTLDF